MADEETRPGTEPGTGNSILDDIKAERTQFFQDREFFLKIGVLTPRDAVLVMNVVEWMQSHPGAGIAGFQFEGNTLTALLVDGEAPKS